jgi:hypothetical protein
MTANRMSAAGLLVGVVCLASSATAGFISISISPEAEFKDGKLRVDLRVLNSGDEAAYFLTPILRFQGEEHRGTTFSVVGPSLPLRETLSVPATEVHEGRWPYEVVVDYTDGAQYPFQALLVSTLDMGRPPPAKVAVSKFDGQKIFRDGELDVSLKSLSGDERSVSLRVLVPEGLEVTNPAAEVVLAASEEKTVSFPLVNRAGIEGSSYPVYVVVEYEDESAHQAIVANSMVQISASEPTAGRSRGLWIIGGVLGVAIIGLIVFRLRGR